jgi:hypothetical protein
VNGIPLLNTVSSLPVPHDDGSWHSAEISRVIECIREYDYRLDVKYIPEQLREPGDAAFAIVENLPDGRQVVAFYVNSEAEMNLDVLARIHGGDNAKTNTEKAMEARNEAEKQLRKKRYEDELAEAHDRAHHMWNSGKNKYNLGGGRSVNL